MVKERLKRKKGKEQGEKRRKRRRKQEGIVKRRMMALESMLSSRLMRVHIITSMYSGQT
tara:strand:+ start:475 stop:651 length:177 start_codon:yes stop_codon:yes gene_type:complete